jgi:hypothetical protein
MKFTAYLFSFLLLSTFSYTSADKKPDMLRHYATHIIADGAAHLAAAGCMAAGFIIGGKLEQNKSSGLAAASALTGIAAALYTVYKTPQWTDHYILNYDTQRSTSQNILTFVCRIFIPFPLGTLLGELESEKRLKEVSTNN